ncbi:MAG: CesT family type III secretion system chaperone [Chlamydiia bacterium]|nr:CesT family type III secretion system chaperone [Chlamydiia bacterium]MCP5505735.1 CesT family type III secretion system chaperone [Chlamydiales bacterium]
MDKFQELLWDLGELIELPLHVDKNHACNLLLDEKLEVQMQMDQHEENLLICAFLADVPPGRFRENVMKDALKVNADYHPFGTLAFYEKKNLLILQQHLPVEKLNGEKLSQVLEQFLEEAIEWQQAINSGSSAPTKYHSVTGKPPPFMK